MKNKIIEILKEFDTKPSYVLHIKDKPPPFAFSVAKYRDELATRIMEQLGGCYVEVKSEDELPEEDGHYITDIESSHYYDSDRKWWWDKRIKCVDERIKPNWWLKKLPPHPKEETDWNKLREQFFEECCEVIYKSYSPISSMKRVAMAPHDLFAWFKKRLSNPLKEPKDSAEKRHEKASRFLSHEVYMNGEFNRIDMALRIAAGLPPTVETKKD